MLLKPARNIPPSVPPPPSANPNQTKPNRPNRYLTLPEGALLLVREAGEGVALHPVLSRRSLVHALRRHVGELALEVGGVLAVGLGARVEGRHKAASVEGVPVDGGEEGVGLELGRCNRAKRKDKGAGGSWR